jgi:hypothetical protein
VILCYVPGSGSTHRSATTHVDYEVYSGMTRRFDPFVRDGK